MTLPVVSASRRNLPHVAVEPGARVRVDGERHRLARTQPCDVRFVDVAGECQRRQVGGQLQQRGCLHARGDRLPRIDIARNDDAVDWRPDRAAIEIDLRRVNPGLGDPHGIHVARHLEFVLSGLQLRRVTGLRRGEPVLPQLFGARECGAIGFELRRVGFLRDPNLIEGGLQRREPGLQEGGVQFDDDLSLPDE